MTPSAQPAAPHHPGPYPDNDAMVALAERLRAVSGCPVAVVALADPQRGWWSVSAGLEGSSDGSTGLNALALQTLLHHGPWLVDDCLSDHDLRLHPCVVGAPWLRSLAGLPLVGADGRVLGALCALGFEPGSLGAESLAEMVSLGRSVVAVIERHGLDLALRRLEWSESNQPATHQRRPGPQLVDRGAFLHALEAMFTLQAAEGFSLLRLECRDHHRLTASLGEAGSAELMNAMGERILALVPESASACRYGEEEFLLLVPRLAATEPLAQLAASLLTVADTPFRIRGVGQGVRVALSVGATVVDGSQASAAAVLAEAGMARRLASAEAGSAFRLIDESMRREVHDAFTRQSHFREALLQGGVLPYFQPIVDLRQGRILGFEALARWRRADGGVSPPSEFLSLARQMGLTGDLDLEVIRQVLEALPAFAAVRGSADPGDSDEALVMSVNLSAQLLDDPDLRARLLALLERCAIPAGLRLQVEILEEALQDASEGFEEFLSRLSVRDVAIAIDDFGTGYSSLSRLDQLPIQSFKVDRSFVERIDDGLSPSNQLLRTMNRLATDLGLAVTAEGVRTEAQRDWLQRHGFVNGQGYLFSRPLPLDEALACLRRQGIAPLPIPAPASREESGAAAGPEAAPALGAGLGRLLRGWLAGEPPAPPS